MYCKLPTNGKQLPAFPLEPMQGSNPGLRGGRRECYHSATMAPWSYFERATQNQCFRYKLYQKNHLHISFPRFKSFPSLEHLPYMPVWQLRSIFQSTPSVCVTAIANEKILNHIVLHMHMKGPTVVGVLPNR